MTKKLVIAGASGLIGQYLKALCIGKYDITVLTRQAATTRADGIRQVQWQPEAAKNNDSAALERLSKELEQATAVINLAGASIADGRLDKRHKARVLSSRVDSTTTLVTALERCKNPPATFFQASAVGYYGDRAAETLDELASAQAGNFLSEVCEAWEAAAQPATSKTRLVVGRIGVVLAKDAPAWQKLLLPIKLFVGGPLGSGQQWFAWIHAHDLARAILYLLENSEATGVYNLVAPEPVQQQQLTQRAANKLGRPAFVPAPAFALRLALGEVADALLLSSSRAVPARLQESGFSFTYPTLEAALEELLPG